jgi:hypothetical protein
MRARLLLYGVLALAIACGRSSGERAGPADGGVTGDAGGGLADATPPPCFTNPQTYLEIINACTDAQAVDKTDDLSPMNVADGGLQPLP